MLREVPPESQVGAGPDPQVSAIGLALVGEQHAGEQGEGAGAAVRLARREAVDVWAAGVRPGRDGGGHLCEVGYLDGEVGTQQLRGEPAHTDPVVEVEQRMTRRAAPRPEEVRTHVVLGVGPAREHRGHRHACRRELLAGEHVGNDHEALPTERLARLTADRCHVA